MLKELPYLLVDVDWQMKEEVLKHAVKVYAEDIRCLASPEEEVVIGYYFALLEDGFASFPIIRGDEGGELIGWGRKVTKEDTVYLDYALEDLQSTYEKLRYIRENID